MTYKVYYFQVYNIVVRHIQNLQNDRPNKSSTDLARYMVITIFPVLYFTIS